MVVVGNGRVTDPKAGEKGLYRTERRPSVLVVEIPAGEWTQGSFCASMVDEM